MSKRIKQCKLFQYEKVERSFKGRNIKKNPCCLTFNNLGIYYCQYGMILENGKIRNAERIGMKCLIKASSYEKNWNNCVSAATAACELYNYNLAYEFFENAYTIKADDLVLYNIGCCLYKLRKYEDALEEWESLLKEWYPINSILAMLVECSMMKKYLKCKEKSIVRNVFVLKLDGRKLKYKSVLSI